MAEFDHIDFRRFLEADNAKRSQSAVCKCSTTWFNREEHDYVVRCNRCGHGTVIKGYLGVPLPLNTPIPETKVETRRYDG